MNLLQLLTRYGTFLLFLLLETVSFYLVVNYNENQEAIFLSSANRLSGGLNERYDKMLSYFDLDEKIRRIQAENAQLISELETLRSLYSDLSEIPDTALMYNTIPAKVFNKSTFGNNNWLTLDVGSKSGVKPGMGVINDKGVVGIVRSVSEKFSLVMAVLHRDMRISGAIYNKSSHGLLMWKDTDPRILDLAYVPRHIQLEPGDTIVTSGFSNIFPKDILVGTILSRQVPQGQNFYEIKVELAYDFFDLDYVYVVESLTRGEVIQLEESIEK